MKTDTLRILRGPNLWSDDTLLEVVLEVDSDLLTPAMLGRLRGWLTKDLATMTQAIWDRSEASEAHHGEACLIAEMTVALQRAADPTSPRQRFTNFRPARGSASWCSTRSRKSASAP